MLTFILLCVFLVCAGVAWYDGFWNATITLVNVLFSAMIATNYFEPLAAWLDSVLPSFTYFMDYIAIWGLFLLTYALLRFTTGKLSERRVKFNMPIEMAGRTIVAVWVSWVMVCFSCATLHVAPLPRTAFRGSFESQPMAANFFATAPDRMWLGFMQSRSRGAFSSWTVHEFDKNSEFLFKYAERRYRLEEHANDHQALRVRK